MLGGVDDVFKALADPTRRAILDELTEAGGQTLSGLRARLIERHGSGSTRQAVSQHLAVLEGVGLVVLRREGRCTFLDLDPASLRRFLSGIEERWRPAGGPLQIRPANS
ncbi:ArsR/SmtB family transcription factor [Kineococcus sp. GCM10028916]|uniref:ArsR/SmtB family transcription factor n=1 Tax=Kineococcus sp. GCM10028916 TaxID=3273394 RepID=UPI0036323CC2